MTSAQRLVLGTFLAAVGCAVAEDGGTGGFEGNPSGGSTAVGGSAGSGVGPSGGSAGVVSTGGVAGVVSAGGFGGVVSTGGSVGAGGSLPTTGGSAGSLGSGGTSGSSSSGGSGGVGGGAGGTPGAGGTTAGSGGKGGSSGTGGTSSSGGTGNGGSSGSSGSTGTGGTGGVVGGSCADFSDDFEDGDTAGWTKSGGTWTVVSDGDMVLEGGGSGEEMIAGSNCENMRIEADVKAVSFGSMSSSYRVGIIGRYTGSSSFYTFSIDGAGDLRLLRSTSNAGSGAQCSTISDGSLVAGQWYHLRMDVTGVQGNIHITTYLDGAQKHNCTITGSNAYGPGRFGVITYGTTTGHFNNFTVTAAP